MAVRQAALALLTGALMASSALVAAAPADGDRLVFITAHYADRAQLQAIASRFQHVIVDPVARTVRVEASHDEYLALRRAGIRVEIDPAATERLQQAEAALTAGVPEVDAITGYPCYRTVEETYATMDQLAQLRPDLAQVIDIGPTWARSADANAGYQMKVLRLNNAATDARFPNKPNMVLFGSIHAREYTPAELLTRFAEGLVAGHGSEAEATWLLDTFRFHFVLQSNPDGRKRAEAGSSWRKNINPTNGVCSASNDGIDLNRNFPFRWNGAGSGSSGDACASNYRGPRARSEPETQNLLRYVAGSPGADGVYRGGIFPDRRGDATTSAAPVDYRGMFLDMHSYSRLVLWPWSHTTTAPPNATALRTLGRRLAWFNGYSPRQWTGLYVADGTTTDTMYGLLGVPSYTIELGVSFFESCSTFQSTTLPQNLAALRYAARNLHAPYVYPAGPETTAVQLDQARVSAGTPIRLTATIDSSRFSTANGTQAVQPLASARAYVDRRPWESNATALVMRAADGAFGSSREVVTVTIPTSGMAVGRHVVFVRGTDRAGNRGTPQAAYFQVDPAQGPAVSIRERPLRLQSAGDTGGDRGERRPVRLQPGD